MSYKRLESVLKGLGPDPCIKCTDPQHWINMIECPSLEVGDQALPAHRLILCASSEVFQVTNCRLSHIPSFTGSVVDPDPKESEPSCRIRIRIIGSDPDLNLNFYVIKLSFMC